MGASAIATIKTIEQITVIEAIGQNLDFFVRSVLLLKSGWGG